MQLKQPQVASNAGSGNRLTPSQSMVVLNFMAHLERWRVMEEEAERQRETIRQLAREDTQQHSNTYIDPLTGNSDILISQ